MSQMIDSDIIEPSIDPATKKIGIRHVKATNAAGTRTKIQVRDFDPVYTDEPSSLGGTNSAPSPLETVLIALVGCDGVIINGVAKAMGFDYTGVDFSCESQMMCAGPRGCREFGLISKVASLTSRFTAMSPKRGSGSSARMWSSGARS